MQRRDARSFLEEVLGDVEALDDETREKLLAIVADKPGTKRAAKLASAMMAATTKAGDADD
jgi:hypothetical protein